MCAKIIYNYNNEQFEIDLTRNLGDLNDGVSRETNEYIENFKFLKNILNI